MEYKIIKFDEISSTNDYLKEKHKSLDDRTVIVSKIQTKGRGRLDRVWESGNGNLYFSMLLKEEINPFELIVKVSLTLVNLLKMIDIDAQIKYPNDILVNGKKISGILIEKVHDGSLSTIIGVGLNVNQVDFGDLNYKATSISILKEDDYNIDEVLSVYLNLFNKEYTLEEYKQKSIILGKYIQYNNQLHQVDDILDDGSLLLKHNDNFVRAQFNEITLEEIYK